jgi:peptide/nickel transport system substrate-binding protein
MRVFRLVPVLLASAVVVAACGGAPAGEPDAPDAQDTTLDVRLVLEPTSLDVTTVAGAALNQLLIDNVYEGLLSRDADGEIVEKLAQSYEVSPDGLTYTFTLRDGLTFADGSPLTSADAVWSLQQAIAPTSKNPSKKDLASIASVTAPDPGTVVITTAARDANLLYGLTNRAGLILKANTDPATLADKPNGSGPYVVESWQRGSAITLTRNPTYWGEQAKTETVVLHYIPDTSAANNAALTGDVDVLTGPDPTLLDGFANPDEFTIAEGVTSDKFVLGINNARGPLADPRVRHALRQAIDKQGLIDVALAGRGTLIGSGVAPTDPWFDESLTSTDAYDPDGAKALLAEAGVGTGLTLNLVVPNIYPARIGEYVASQLGEVGVTVNYQPVEFAVWLDQVFTKADYDLSIVDHAEARDIANYANPDYYWRYNSPQVQQLAAQATAAPDEAARDALYRQVAQQISADAASDWLYSPKSVVVTRPGVNDFPTREINSRLPLAGVGARSQE